MLIKIIIILLLLIILLTTVKAVCKFINSHIDTTKLNDIKTLQKCVKCNKYHLDNITQHICL